MEAPLPLELASAEFQRCFHNPSIMGRKGKKSKKALEDELQKQAEEQKRREEQERLQKLEEDCATTHRTRLEAELEAKERVEEAERLEEESEVVTRMKGDRK